MSDPDYRDAPEAERSENLRSARGPSRLKQSSLDLVAKNGVVIALLVLFVGFSLALPSTFFTTANIKTIVNSQAIVLLLALAATVPLRAGEFDLSVGATMTISAAITGQVLLSTGSIALAALAVMGLALIVGSFHAFLIIKLQVNAFVTTLGTLTALSGLAYAVTNTAILTGFSETFLNVSRAEFLGLPALTWYAWVLVVVIWFVYEWTPSGRYLLLVGGNESASRLAGINVERVKAGAFLSSALISALAGFMLASSIGSVDPSISGQFLLQPFAAAFLGATTITLGRFNAFGTLFGLYLLVVGIAGLQLLGAQPWVANVFNGTALVIAVTLARLAARAKGDPTRSA